MSDDLTYADAICQMGHLEDRIAGLADEFDTMGDDHDTLTWLVAEMSAAMPMIIMSLRALTIAVDAIVKKTGVTVADTDLAPEPFTPPNRAARRQAARNGQSSP